MCAHIQRRLSVLSDRHVTKEIRQTDVPILDVLALSCSSSGFRAEGRVNEVRQSFIIDGGQMLTILILCPLSNNRDFGFWSQLISD